MLNVNIAEAFVAGASSCLHYALEPYVALRFIGVFAFV